MLLYLPVRRFVLHKDIASRRLYITSDEIVYKVTRPSILPLLGLIKVEQRIPLHVVIGIVIEQGCLQSIYGVHTFRIECITHGKAAPVGELQFQGVSNPRLLRKVIILEATKRIQEVGNRKLTSFSGDALSTPTMRSLTDVPNSSRWKSPSMKVKASPRHAFSEAGVLCLVICCCIKLKKSRNLCKNWDLCLCNPMLKDTAFPLTERDRLGLRGLLPPRVISFEQQHQRFMFGMGPSNPANMIAMQQQQQGGFGNIQTHTQNLQSGMVNLPNTTQNANFPQQRQQNQS